MLERIAILCGAILLLVLLAPMTYADTLVTRMDGDLDQIPAFKIGVVTQEIEIWGLGVNKPNPTIEIGKLFVCKTTDGSSIFAGGYFSHWGNDKMFVEPYVWYEKPLGKTLFAAELYAYLSLKGGSIAVGSSNASLTMPVDKHYRFGLAGTFWHEPGFHVTNYGGQVSYAAKDWTATARYLPFGHNQPTFRLQVSQNF